MGASRDRSPDGVLPSGQGLTRSGAAGHAPSGGSFDRAHDGHPADPKLAIRQGEGRRHNLPATLTSFVGREAALAEAMRLLDGSRLLTLVGSGGIGKTRLALRIASDLVDAYPDGAWLVELAPLADPLLMPLTVAAALGVHEQPGRPMLVTLAEHVAARHLLLILDNCEHMVPASAELSEALLRACPSLRILATSRQALGIEGETIFRVPSLSLPDASTPPDVERLAQYEAVHLFVDRATATAPHFRLTEPNVAVIADICRQLDGVPLAIELAATRLKLLGAEQLAALCVINHRLGHRMREAMNLALMAQVLFEEGDVARAEVLNDQSFTALQAAGPGWGTILTLCMFGRVASARGDHPTARKRLEESLELGRKLGTLGE